MAQPSSSSHPRAGAVVLGPGGSIASSHAQRGRGRSCAALLGDITVGVTFRGCGEATGRGLGVGGMQRSRCARCSGQAVEGPEAVVGARAPSAPYATGLPPLLLPPPQRCLGRSTGGTGSASGPAPRTSSCQFIKLGVPAHTHSSTLSLTEPDCFWKPRPSLPPAVASPPLGPLGG